MSDQAKQLPLRGRVLNPEIDRRIGNTKNRLQLTGQRFGMLVVMEMAGVRKRKSLWNVRCDCGTEKVVAGIELTSGRATSCTCQWKKWNSTKQKHGKTAYSIWKAMMARCYNPNTVGFVSYGGRGISVCDRWKNFDIFFADMWPRPKGMSIERIDNNGNYEPANCRWATRAEQGLNQRSNHMVTVDGVSRPLSYWASLAGIHRAVIFYRLRAGWNPKDAVFKPPMQMKRKSGAAK